MSATLDNIDIVVNPGASYYKEILREIAEVQGWCFTEQDYDTWLSSYHKFWYFFALEKDTQKPVGCVALGLDEYSAVSAELLYSVGFFYCSPSYRGTGLGLRLWDTMFAIPEKNANIVLHGAVDMGPKYAAKYGFGLIPCRNIVTNFVCKDVVNKLELSTGILTKDITTIDWEDVNTYETSVNPRPHPKFLRKWMVNRGTFSRIAHDVTGKPIGICCIREDVCGDLSCGPFYAETPEAGLALLWETLAMIKLSNHNMVRLIYYEGNTEVDSVVDKITNGKFETVKRGFLQFTKKIIEVPRHKIYSVSDVAMGHM